MKSDHKYMLQQIAETKCMDTDNESKENKSTEIRITFLSKWGHPHLCQLDENDHLDINYKPTKLCSHYKKGKGKDEQIRLNRIIVQESHQYKSKFEIQYDKIFTTDTKNLWTDYTYRKFFQNRVLIELIEKPPTLKKLSRKRN